MRRGRFVETSQLLDSQASSHTALNHRALLADALQRIGQNKRAESLCIDAIRNAKQSSPTFPLSHFVLGNIQRERGHLTEAIQHFQRCIDSQLAGSELVCWGELRLAATVAEMDGTAAAMARLPNVHAAIAECGDVRPFIAFHLWLAELESLGGRLLDTTPPSRQGRIPAG